MAFMFYGITTMSTDAGTRHSLTWNGYTRLQIHAMNRVITWTVPANLTPIYKDSANKEQDTTPHLSTLIQVITN
ncbi:hypothetical protein BGAL_0142g00190 [Botrytis galanthina]|uniref:Uncharacterized protein n=1 Tax=Botrytis galanthina TaxID=278940 RepID=A0A4S8QZ22_9HELO|nr:hypothetical protein BGAL_0142g00190 [Botrytis galanthina]